ncbi:MAG: iron transporter [Halopseudomonas sp.]|uniref:iron transporter n=1 Tax=Halopseudomonas sp. TaxID=2901191 RepID=UPI0030012A3E
MSKSSSAGLPVWPTTLTRILLAVLGGYALTYSFTAALARLLPGERIDAAISATLASFLVYTCYVLWVYAVPLRRGLLSLLAILPLALIGFWPQLFGGQS